MSFEKTSWALGTPKPKRRTTRERALSNQPDHAAQGSFEKHKILMAYAPYITTRYSPSYWYQKRLSIQNLHRIKIKNGLDIARKYAVSMFSLI